MWVSKEHLGPLILIFKKIQMCILTRAESLFTLCYETPCKYGFIEMKLTSITILSVG